MTDSAASRLGASTPRLSMVALGLVAGLAGLWVYAAVQQSRPASDTRSTLRRTRTIRRHRRQQRSDAIAEEILLEEAHAEAAPPALAPRPSYAERRAALSHLGDASSSDSDEASEDASGVSMRLLHLLCTVSEQHARANSIVHRGTQCNGCQEAPIRGTRYKCAQCANVDLCAACEAHELHGHHVMLKMAVPLPALMNPRVPLIRKLYPGSSLVPRQLARDVARRLEQSTRLDRMDLAGLYAEFCVLATRQGEHEELTRAAFDQCLGAFGGPTSVLAQRLFAFYDEHGRGALTFDDVAHGFSAYTRGSVEDKAGRVFRAYDVDADGRVGRSDVRVVLEACAQANRELTRGMVRAMEQDIVEDAGKLLPGQPTSAAFTAPVAHDAPTVLDKEVNALRAEVLALRESAARRVAAAAAAGSLPSDPAAEEASEPESVAATTAATAGSRRLLRLPSDPEDTALPDRPLSAEMRQPAPTFWHDRTEDDHWPVMEALSLDAVRIMVDDIFDEAKPADPAFFTRDEFA
ncbi:hypothetical protein GGI15_000878, partial [Coemansia interrupta]